jgi:hypothetical protein
VRSEGALSSAILDAMSQRSTRSGSPLITSKWVCAPWRSTPAPPGADVSDCPSRPRLSSAADNHKSVSDGPKRS